MTSLEPAAALAKLATKISSTIVSTPELHVEKVNGEFAQLRGVLNNQHMHMHCHRYRSTGYESIILSVLSSENGNVHAVTLIGLPVPGSPFPIIGLDAVALGPRWSLLALDLAPTDKGFWEHHCAPALKSLRERVHTSVKIRRLPEFAQHSFSRLALIAAVQAGHEHLVADEVIRFVRQHALPLLTHTTSGLQYTDGAAQLNLAWRNAERGNRKEQKALESLFGEERARHLIDDFLFPIPDSLPS